MVKLADVIPFRGIRYSRSLVPDLSEVVIPPYDVITPEAQKDFYKRNEYNAVRLDFGAAADSDTETDSRYTRAAKTLDEWLRKEILIQDPEPAVYCLREEYMTLQEKAAVRDAVIAAVRLTDFSEGRIVPHEETSASPKKDRLELMEATEANLSPIFCLYPDPEHAVGDVLQKTREEEPDLMLTDERGTRHSLWKVSDPQAASALCELISSREILIADGHHRYETALAYRDQRRSQDKSPAGDQPYDFVMAYLADIDSTRESILPIHRFIYGLSWDTVAELPGLFEEKFEVRTMPETGPRGRQIMMSAMSSAGPEHNVFGLRLPGDDSYHLLVGRQPKPMLTESQNGHSDAYRSLDVAVLDHLIITDLLEISPGGINEDAAVDFVAQSRVEAAEADNREVQAIFYVRAPSMDDIRTVTAGGGKMPRKSTFFFPKPLTGLVFRSLKTEL